MKILIIDSNDVRKQSLEEQLTKVGISWLSSSAHSAIADERAIHAADVLIVRDQTIPTLTKADNEHPKVIITNMLVLKEQYGTAHNVFLLNQQESEEAIIEKVNTLYKDYNNRCFLPIVEDPRSKAVLEIARKAAKSKANILISGETGVGKELLARYIHYHSAFFNGPFISVNCAAMPDNMVEAILFGYEKGAFTNAINSYAGKFEQAQHGTLLLDEISEIPLGLQAKLLRVLQEREVERICGKKIINIDVRVIAATNQDLKQLAEAGMFRKDLYYRLNVLPIHCPPLRERPHDIIPLADYFISQHADALGKTRYPLTECAKQKLLSYAWPGNVREMDNVIQRALILTEKCVLDESDIELHESENSKVENTIFIDQMDSKLKVNEAQTIMNVLKETNGCRGIAAKKLNISPRTLRYKISKLKSIGIKIP